MHRRLYVLLALLICLLPASALAATYQASTAEELQTALASAADGDTIRLVGALTDIGNVVIDKDLTITGGTVTGNSNFRLSGDQKVTFRNVTFQDISNPANNLSAIYAENLSGSLTVTDSTFEDVDWDAIQVTPVDGAEITITDNTFRDADATVRQQRYVHIQSALDTDFAATVTGNRMFDDPAQEALGVYYPSAPDKLDLDRNFIADTVTYPVCILNGEGENIAEIAYPLVDENGQVRRDQAVLGKSEFYATAYPSLEAAAAAGETDLVLIQDTALKENVDFPAGATLDLNGKTLTLAPGVTLPDTLTVNENGGQITQALDVNMLLWVLLLLAALAIFAWYTVIWLARGEN